MSGGTLCALAFLLQLLYVTCTNSHKVMFLVAKAQDVSTVQHMSKLLANSSVVLCSDATLTDDYNIYIHMRYTCLSALQRRSPQHKHIMAYAPYNFIHPKPDFDGYIHSSTTRALHCSKDSNCTRIPYYVPLECPQLNNVVRSKVGIIGVQAIPDLRVPAEDILPYLNDMNRCDFFARISVLILWKPALSTLSFEEYHNYFLWANVRRIPTISHSDLVPIREYNGVLSRSHVRGVNSMLELLHTGVLEERLELVREAVLDDVNDTVAYERLLSLFAMMYKSPLHLNVRLVSPIAYFYAVPTVQDIYLSLFGSNVRSISEEEFSGMQTCSFVADDMEPADCAIEKDKHLLVKRYIQPSDSVLEVGAKYGTTSCALAAATENSGRVVSVESHPIMWNALRRNRIRHRCNFYSVVKPIGNRAVSVAGDILPSVEVASFTTYHDRLEKNPKEVDYYTYSAIQSVVGFNFTVLLIDCEGCIEYLFEGNDVSLRELLQNVRVILLEADMPRGGDSPCKVNCVDYSKWENMLSEAGFRVDTRVADFIVFYRR